MGSFDPQSIDWQLRHQTGIRGLMEQDQPCVVPKGSVTTSVTAVAAVPLPESHREGLCTAQEPRAASQEPAQENRVRRGRRGRLLPWGQPEIRELKLNELPVPSAIKGNLKEFQFGDIINFPFSSSLPLQFRRVLCCLLTE